MKRTALSILTLMIVGWSDSAFAEFRSSKDMQKECRVTLDVIRGKADKSFQNSFFTGECVGYVQGAVDVSLVVSGNAAWYKACPPKDVPTFASIEKFIAFVDKNPKYTLASTALQVMLAVDYPCQKK